MDEERPIRIGDREREDAVKRLGAHYEAGRLSAEEHQERVGEALQAKTKAELAALFIDLPEQSKADQDKAEQGEQWAGPWGWTRSPWTAPQDRARGESRGPRGPLGRVPLPLLIALAAVAVLASVACVVGGGHPPVLPLLLIVAGVVIYNKRKEQRA